MCCPSDQAKNPVNQTYQGHLLQPVRLKSSRGTSPGFNLNEHVPVFALFFRQIMKQRQAEMTQARQVTTAQPRAIVALTTPGALSLEGCDVTDSAM